MGRDVEAVIDQEMKRCWSVVTTDMQKILKLAMKLKDRLETLEDDLLREQTENRQSKEKLTEAETSNKDLEERIELLTTQARDKEIQMDILSDQVKRRNQMLDEQRARFHKEVMRYKTRIYELNHRLEAGETQGGGRRHSGMGADMDLSTLSNPAESVEVMEEVDKATREIREQMLSNISSLKQQHAKEKKELLHQKKLAIDERDNEIYHLKMNIKSMDRIIEVEKRRLMKNREMELKEIQEKYEQKISALHSEIGALKAQSGVA